VTGRQDSGQVPLTTIVAEWGRIGCIGFGGPPAHIRLLRDLCVKRRGWLDPQEFEDAIAVCNLLPGPASTQLAIFCAWRLRGRAGALAGGVAFILPGLVVILALAALFLGGSPPLWVLGAGAGAGAAVPAVAVHAGAGLTGASWRRRSQTGRWLAYLIAGGAAAATIGVWLVLVLLGCGLIELAVQHAAARGSGGPREHGPDSGGRDSGEKDNGEKDNGEKDNGEKDNGGRDSGGARRPGILAAPVLAAGALTGGVLLSVAWVGVKVGALSYGGGFVIIPLMQSDAVSHYHWLTGAQFLNAVALGQITPGPVVQTVAVVGYGAAGLVGGILASVVAFSPSFAFILLGAGQFARIRADRRARAFLDGAGPAAIGAIFGSAIPLTRALGHSWQYAILAGALLVLLLLRRGVVLTLLICGAAGVIIALTAGSALH
jgi:chromate transporter